MRTFLGFLVAGVGLAAALYLHTGVSFGISHFDTGYTASGRYVGTEQAQQVANGGSIYGVTQTVTGSAHVKASWQDPVAVLIAVAGVGAAAGIVLRPLRVAT